MKQKLNEIYNLVNSISVRGSDIVLMAKVMLDLEEILQESEAEDV